MKRIKNIAILLLITLLLAGCDSSNQQSNVSKSDVAKAAVSTELDTSVLYGTVWYKSDAIPSTITIDKEGNVIFESENPYTGKKTGFVDGAYIIITNINNLDTDNKDSEVTRNALIKHIGKKSMIIEGEGQSYDANLAGTYVKK